MTTRRQMFLASALAAPGLPLAAAEGQPKLDSEKFRDAVTAGDLASVTAFLNRDPALLYSRDIHGNSVYLLACLARQTQVAEYLASHGLVFDIFEAAAGGKVEIATELVKANPALVNLRSLDGRTALHIAV